jgi:hypothetical protein
VSDVVAWLRAELDRVEQTAQATTVYQPYDEWTPVGVDEDRDTARSCWEVALIARPAVRSPSARSLMEHIAAHDPAAVLRRVAADRRLLDDLLNERHEVVEDDWYTCPAATVERDGGECCDENRIGDPCNCGRDERAKRRVRLLAEGYGWEEPR